MSDAAPNPPSSSTPSARIPPFDPKAFLDTAIAVLLRPQEFFRGLKDETGFMRCLMFSVPAGILSGVLGFLSIFVHGGSVGWAIRVLVQYAIAGLFGPFVAGLIVWGICLALGSKASVEPSIRICAYTFAVEPVILACTLVPWIGWIGAAAAVVYGFYLVYLGAQALNFAEPASEPPAPPGPPAPPAG